MLLPMGTHILIFNIFMEKTFKMHTLLNEVVTVEKINVNFSIEVMIQRQLYSECMLDLCVSVKNHSNKRQL